jgi:hypothetical protein
MDLNLRVQYHATDQNLAKVDYHSDLLELDPMVD